MNITEIETSTSLYTKIERTESLIKEIKDEIYKKELIQKSLTDTLISQVQSIRMPLSEKIITKAISQQNEKKKKDRISYEFVKAEIADRFFNGKIKEIQIQQITHCGYNSYAFQFKIKFHKTIFALYYPCPQNISTEADIFHGHSGKYALFYYENKIVLNHLVESYHEEDIAKAIEKFIAERESVNESTN